MPPMIIYPGKTVNTSYDVDLPLGSLAYTTESGWINTDAFYVWLCKLFFPNLPAIRHVLLVFDDHTSHLDLPPHTTHTSQPNRSGKSYALSSISSIQEHY